ncbi:MAG TPA: carboxypeptidase-like regulatory domain-containing protein [Acidobacteriaceae bacterium]|nr:carboxypeptidase-like regulatory domain-containing protein [Acidobacteriaceae bacterium]
MLRETVRPWLIPLTAVVLVLGGAQGLRAQDAAGYTLRGTIVNSLTGQGVPRALVTLNEEYAVLTGGDGQFSIDHVPAGTYAATVSKPGYLGVGYSRHGSGHLMHDQPSPPEIVHVGPDVPDAKIALVPTASIAGQISLSTADSADGIRISIYRRQTNFGHARWVMAGSAQSRIDGTFHMAELPPGSYMLATSASLDNPNLAEMGPATTWGYPPAYYPGVTDPGAAGVITLAAGQQGEADIALTHQQFFPVTAMIRASDMRMPGEFNVLDMGGHPTGLSAQFDTTHGLVRANLPNGSWILEGRGYGREMTWGRVEVHVASAPVTVALNMQSVPHIPVNVQRSFTSSTVSSSGPGVNLLLVSADPFGTSSVSGGESAVPGSNGTAWQMNVAEPGRFWVEASTGGASYVSSISSGGTDLASNPLVVEPGSTPASIDVTLRDDGGGITGQLNTSTANAPGSTEAADIAAQVTVYAIPQFPFVERLPQTRVGQDGTFSFTNLAPGSWRVVACDAPQDIDFHSPDALAAWTGQGQTVTVEAGGTAHVTLDVTHVEATP